MKFTDGYWHARPGIIPHYATEAHEVITDTGTLTAYAPTEKVVRRGDTLDLPVLTVRYSSPMPNVIGVSICHHKGAHSRGPHFQLASQEVPDIQVRETDHDATLTSGRLSVQVRKGEWHVQFKAGERIITGSGKRALGYIETPEGNYIHEQLDLAVGECVYGLGERFTSFVKNGQVIDLWNEDGGTNTEQAYKNIPFYFTNRGYGVFINHPERVSLEVASENVERMQFSVPGERLEYYVIYGPSPKEVLQRYTALTGRPALPPAWSFGLWLTTSFTTSYDEKTVTGLIQGMADRDIPLAVFHFDCFWMREFHWVDLQWDERVFPDPPSMLERLRTRGLRICVWINPYIAQQSGLFDEAMENGYLLKRLNGDVWQWDRWQAGMALVDFTNPDAQRWYGDKLRALLAMGVDCFKTDFGERIPTDVTYFDNSDPHKMHNYYAYLYNETVFDVLQQERGAGEAVVFARSATSGGQQFPVHWGGDCTATYPSMAESLRGGLSLCLSGFGFWSHDIGGFEQSATPDLYKRWCAFGLLSTHSRLHGNESYRVPWLFDEEAVDVLRFFTKLKCCLMPYIFGAACEAHETGVPIMRAMMLEFPGDPTCDYLDRQYMLGGSLLVAPIFSQDGIVDYYLPPGRWTNFFTGRVIDGGRWLRETHDYMSLPLMVRPNSVIPVGSNDRRPDYDYADGITLRIFELEDGSTNRVTIPDMLGQISAEATVRRNGSTITVSLQAASGVPESWNVLFVGQTALSMINGGSAVDDTLGILVASEHGAETITVRLRE